MKDIITKINEGINTSFIIKKIESEFENEFGNDVTLGKGRVNNQMMYDVYVYTTSIDILKKVNEILKKYLAPKFEGFTDDELNKKINDKEEFLKEHNKTIKDFPIEFGRFDSKGLKNLNNKNYKYKIVY